MCVRVCVCVCRFTGFTEDNTTASPVWIRSSRWPGSFLLLSETYSGEIRRHTQPSQPSGCVRVCVCFPQGSVLLKAPIDRVNK